MTIQEIEARFITPSHAPYKDGHTAKLERRINTLREEVSELEKENKTLLNRLDNRSQSPNKGGDKSQGQSLGNFEATFYTARCDGCSGITATGIDVRESIYHEGKRIVAVDPSVIALGSDVKVTLEDGSTFEAVAGDTGGDIKGGRIDVLVATKEEARRLGRMTAKVEAY